MNERPDTAKRSLLRSAAQIVAGLVASLSHAQPAKAKPILAGRTGWVYDEAYLTPVFEPSHPERPQRVQAMAKAIRDSALNSQLELLKPQSVRASEVDNAIKLIHTQTHIDSVRGQYSAAIVDLARLAVAGCLRAADAVMSLSVRGHPGTTLATPAEKKVFAFLIMSRLRRAICKNAMAYSAS
jgi:hypothetical protein